MPVPLLDDGVSVTYQLDDGSTVKVAKDAALRIGAPMPGPAPTPSPFPSQMFGAAPGATPNAIPIPPIAVPPVPPPVSDAFAGAPGAPAPQPASPPPPPRELGNAGAAIGGGAAGAPAPGMPARKPAPTTDQMHAAGNFGDVTGGINDAYAGLQQANNDHAVVQQAAAMRTANELEHNAAQIAAQDALIQKQKTEALAEVQRKGSAVQAAVDDWAKTSIDPNRAWKSLSGAGKAGLIFSQLIAGLGSALKHQGDKNPAVDMWLHQVDQDIRLQMDARDQKREAIGYAKDALSAFKDIANSKNELLLLGKAAMIEQGQRRLEIINAQTKSAEVKANTEAANAQLGLAKQQTLGEWAKTAFSSEMQKRQQANADRQTAIAGGHLALANKEFKEGIRRFDLDYAQKERMHKDDLDEKIALAKSSGKTSEAKQLEDERKFSVGAPTTVAKDKAGNVVRNEDGSAQVVRESLKNKDGTPWLARNEQQADEFGNKIAVAGEINDILNEVQSIRDDVGAAKLAVTKYSPIPSDAKARLDVLQNRLVVLAKSGTQGMSSDEDMQKLSATLGAKDLAAFTTNAAGLKEAQARTQSQLNREARVRYNYSGPPITFDDVQKVSANPADKAYEAVAKGQTREQLAEGATPGKARRALEYVTGGGILYKSSNEKAEEAASGDATSPYGVTSDAQAGIDDLTRQMRSKDRGTAVNAKEKLVQLSKEHPDLAPAIAQSVRDQAPELWGVVKTQFPANAVKTAERSGSAGAFSDVTDFAPDAIARQALQDNAEGRRIAKEVMEASKSPDPAVRKAAADVLREAQRIQKGP